MKLQEHLDSMPLLRQAGEPAGNNPLTLIVLSSNLIHLPAWLKERKNFHIGRIFIPDLPENTPLKISLPSRHGIPDIICGIKGLKTPTEEDVVFLYPSEYFIRKICMECPNLAVNKIWFSKSDDPALKLRHPISDFYESNKNVLNEVYELWADFGSRNTFAGRIKALETGNPGYLPLASHNEYEYPAIKPQGGDIMIDGGISDMVWAQQKFSLNVGDEGKIYGFEPIGWMADKAEEQLAPYKNYQLHHMGLGAEAGTARFSSLHDSSCINESAQSNYEICNLTSIDEFKKANQIQKINCIKLDIEGSELSALKGAKKTISSDKPRLIICLYHKPQDIYQIPLYIKELVSEYQLFVAHSSCGFTDTILYGK